MIWLPFTGWGEHRLYVDDDAAGRDRFIATIDRIDDGWRATLFFTERRELDQTFKSWRSARNAVNKEVDLWYPLRYPLPVSE